MDLGWTGTGLHNQPPSACQSQGKLASPVATQGVQIQGSEQEQTIPIRLGLDQV